MVNGTGVAMDQVRIGLIGTGFIADWHLAGFAGLPGARVIGMARDFYGDEAQRLDQLERLRNKCEHWGVRAYANVDELMEDPEVNAVVIGSINPLHLGHIELAIRAGKHMLVEKPVLTELGDLDRVGRACRERGVKLFPGHNFVYRGAVERAKELLVEGHLGRVIQASLVVTHTISPEHASGWRAKRAMSAGGALMDSGHHLVYQSLYLLGMPRALQAFTARRVLLGMECEDTAQVNLAYPDGSLGIILQSWASSHGEGINGIRILGERSSLVISDALYLDGVRIDADTGYGESFAHQARAFIDYVVHDRAPRSDLGDARSTLRIIQAAYESAGSGTVVTWSE
jgi:predicted dehydrogenase